MTHAEADASILWPPNGNSQIIGKDPGAGKDWRQKRVTDDEIFGWQHLFNGQGLGQTPGDGEGQGSLECCHPWGCEELDMNSKSSWDLTKVRHEELATEQQ